MQQRVRFMQAAVFWGLIAALLFAVLRIAVPLLWPLAGGFLLAYLFQRISKRIRLRSGAPVALIAMFFYAAVITIVWALSVLAIGRILRAAQELPTLWQNVLQPAGEALTSHLTALLETLSPTAAAPLENLFSLGLSVTEELAAAFSVRFAAAVTAGVRALPMFLIGFLFLIVSSVYICMDYPRVSRFLMRQVPADVRTLVLGAKDHLFTCFGRTLRAYALISFITFAELWIGMTLLRTGSWRMALLIAFCDLLPLIGSGAFLLPWGIYHLAAGNPGTGLGLLALWAIITVVRNMIEPRIVGDHLGLHPVATLASMFIGLRLLGVWGVFAAPFAVMLLRYLNGVGVRLYRE